MIDVIIPVYKPTEYLLSILLMLKRQTMCPSRVIIINTEKNYWDSFFGDYDIKSKYPFLEIHHIKKEEFDHGRTRNLGVKYSKEPFFLLMTDDAVPADENLIKNMYDAFENEKVGMSYARQMPQKGCHIIEKYTRYFNYSAEPVLKTKDSIESMGIKAFFASDVCCMYRRSVYNEVGAFVEPCIFNEDMIFARRMLEKDYAIAYSPNAMVFHSHNYSGIQYLKRNFDLGVSHAMYPDVFGDVKSEGEGIRLVKKTALFLCSKLMPWLVIKLVYQSGCKYIGYFCGRRYDKLPKSIIMKLSSNPGFFT